MSYGSMLPRSNRHQGWPMLPRTPRPPTAKSQEKLVVTWNLEYPVGTPVKYFPVAGVSEFKRTKTTTPAWFMGGHSAMVTVEGVSGGVSLRHIQLDTESEVAK